jgi:hypothetical protein
MANACSVQEKNSANHEFIHPSALCADHAPARELSATLRYCRPVAVLERESYVFFLPSVAKLESLVSHRPPNGILSDIFCTLLLFRESSFDIDQMRYSLRA